MHFTQILGAAVLGAGLATADFMVYTEPPIPTSAIPTFSNQAEANKWTTSVFFNAGFAFGAWERGEGAPYQSSKTSVRSAMSAFVASNANYSIPAAVTETDGTTSFYTAPPWYTALPSGVREFKEKQVSAEFSAVRDQIIETTAGAAGASRTSQGGAVVQTPAVGVLGLGGMGVAAFAAGVFL
ncbi:unnamed protein product [Periconia digitata]|uniref:Uncharacterized protein n=1 Tax=Periconia digitata TaxID=1303443 RepID=A0A9W4XZ47_9PLEO|nr:unnamed protein product [Periconia digitata]